MPLLRTTDRPRAAEGPSRTAPGRYHALLVGVPALSPAAPSSAVPGPGDPSAGAGCADTDA